nr:hypothetical protein GCM10020093_073150 [Planobispora longispora]
MRRSTSNPTPAKPRVPTMDALRERHERLRDQIVAGRRNAVERQHGLGKRTARERLELLLDEGSFVEIDMYRKHQAHGLRMEENKPHTDGVVTGAGTIHGRRVFVYAQDFAIFGGSLGRRTPPRSRRCWIWPSRPARPSSG